MKEIGPGDLLRQLLSAGAEFVATFQVTEAGGKAELGSEAIPLDVRGAFPGDTLTIRFDVHGTRDAEVVDRDGIECIELWAAFYSTLGGERFLSIPVDRLVGLADVRNTPAPAPPTPSTSRVTIAKLPLAKDLEDFVFADTPINESLVRDLSGGEFLAHDRNVVLVGGTGTGKTHLAIGIARACIRAGSRGRFYNVVDLVNRLEAEARTGRQGRMADYLSRMDYVVLDELGYLPFAQSGGQLLFQLIRQRPPN